MDGILLAIRKTMASGILCEMGRSVDSGRKEKRNGYF